jgi:hypothetical protein
LAAKELGFRRGIHDGGGDSGHPGSILQARRKRAARRTFSVLQRSKGRCLMVAEGDGHGG